MSSSDSSADVKSKKTTKGKSSSKNQDYQIKPAKGGASIDTSSWPLLLKVTFYFILTLLLKEL